MQETGKGKLDTKKLLAVVAVVLAIAMICYEIRMFAVSNTKTQAATSISYKNSVTVKMFAVRDESLISSSSSNTYVPLLQDGERVAGGQAIAAQFAKSESANAYVELNRLKNELSRYESLNSQQNLIDLDMSKLNAQADTYFYDMLNNVRSGDLASLDSSAENFSDKLTAKYILKNGNIDFSEKITALKAQIASLSAQVGTVDYLKSDDTGYYVSTADGYENKLDFSKVTSLSCDDIKAAISSEPAAIPENTKGKLIHGYTWYFVGVVSAADATKFDDGDLVTLRCDNVSHDGITAQITYRGPISGEEAVLVVESRIMDASIAQLRVEDVEIVISETDGIRVNKSAVRVVDGIQGVYVLTGSLVKFKRLDVLYTGDDYVISRMITQDEYDDQDRPYLKIYDEIILEGKDLKDGQLINS